MTRPSLEMTPINPSIPCTVSVTNKNGHTREISLTPAQQAKIASIFQQMGVDKIDAMTLKGMKNSRDLYFTSNDANIKALREELLKLLPEDCKPQHGWDSYNTGSRSAILAQKSFDRTLTWSPTSLKKTADISEQLKCPKAKFVKQKQVDLIKELTARRDALKGDDQVERRELLTQHIDLFEKMDLPAVQFALAQTDSDTKKLYASALDVLKLNDGINRHAVEDAVHLAKENIRGYKLEGSRALYEHTREELKRVPLQTNAARRFAGNFFAGMSSSRDAGETEKMGEARRDGAELFFVRLEAAAHENKLSEFLGYAMQTTFGTLEAADREAVRQILEKLYPQAAVDSNHSDPHSNRWTGSFDGPGAGAGVGTRS